MDGSDREAIEREAAAIFRAARADPSNPPPPQTLVTRLLGIGSVRVVPAAVLPVGGAIARVGDRWRVYLRAGIAPQQARFTVLHELAHWALGASATEEECDALAARLLAPREAFQLALKREGKNFTRLARWFGCTETFAALRYGEVTDEPLVVVAPASVRIRGREWSWPAERELRGLTKARRLPGLHKAQLRDDPRRVALSVTRKRLG